MIEKEHGDGSDSAADDSSDGQALAAAVADALDGLVIADDAEDDGEPSDGGAGGEADDSEHETGDAESVAAAGGVEGGAFHGEGHAAGFAVVGGDGAGGGAFAAADDLLAVGLADDFWSAIASGGVGVDRVRVLLDDLARFWIDQAAVTVLDGDRDGVSASGALAVLGGLGGGGF